MAKTAVTPTRADDYPEWYQAVIRAADMAENAPDVRGCMIIKPWGYGLWEEVRDHLDRRIKATGHDNAYFPLFIPLRFIEKEATHVEGFAKEMAVVTHHRLTQGEDGRLKLDGELEEPLIVRPTSETIIGEAMAKWIRSYRDLPLKLNQWANVVRWEMRPRLFLRTSEFLWQEGHTAHATADDAMAHTRLMLEKYREVVEDEMAIPVIQGEKSAGERFPGASATLTIEAMMQDGKALQAGTSHFLGQSFSKAATIRFQTREETLEHVWTTSFGASTRLIGALIMTHGDDDGLQLPPRIARHQIVITPILRDEAKNDAVMAYGRDLAERLNALTYSGRPVRAHLDDRDVPAPDKRWEWIKKGVPYVIEIGPRDVEGLNVAVTRRDRVQAKKAILPRDQFIGDVVAGLEQIQTGLQDRAVAYRATMMHTGITDYAAFKAHFDDDSHDRHGFVRAYWCEDEDATEPLLKPLGVTIRCLPFDQPSEPGTCVLTGKPANRMAIFARAY